jgi:3-oxoacyl-[acyl-carrier protein] reductase
MNLDLKGKRALVCGSTQGIGKAAALELASMGAHVTLVARNPESLSASLNELSNDGMQQHDYIAANFNDPDGLRTAICAYTERETVHILVNNTGGPPGGPIVSAAEEEFVKAFTSHLVCNHILVKACVEGMKRSGYGRIVNVISTSVKQPLKGLGVSNTVRAAVGNWAKTLSGELAPFGITVNNVLPGATRTQRLSSLLEARSARSGVPVKELEEEMLHEIPAGRFAEVHETAAAIAFLASPAAAYINGINLPVDGGRTSSL